MSWANADRQGSVGSIESHQWFRTRAIVFLRHGLHNQRFAALQANLKPGLPPTHPAMAGVLFFPLDISSPIGSLMNHLSSRRERGLEWLYKEGLVPSRAQNLSYKYMNKTWSSASRFYLLLPHSFSAYSIPKKTQRRGGNSLKCPIIPHFLIPPLFNLGWGV